MGNLFVDTDKRANRWETIGFDQATLLTQPS